jgi:ABC-2 type transport system ATP-binding protein
MMSDPPDAPASPPTTLPDSPPVAAAPPAAPPVVAPPIIAAAAGDTLVAPVPIAAQTSVVAYSIVAESLTKVFRGVPAVDGLTLRVARGRFFGFLGPNGAGKSTTIKMLTGLLRPTSGRVTIEGRALDRDLLGVKGLIGVLPEELALYERLSGEEYLLFAGRMYGLTKAEARSRTDELLEFLSLQDERGKLIVDYSQGMRKKLALAAALIHNPRVLFLDEPLNGIDPVSGRVVTDLLRRLARKGVTLFFTSHVLDVVERLCDEVAIIERGKLIAQGTLDEIRAQRAVGRDASLEDVFLKLVSADVAREDLSWIA